MTQTERFEGLLEGSSALTAEQQQELLMLQDEADRFMLCKAQAAAILRWRGYSVLLPQ